MVLCTLDSSGEVEIPCAQDPNFLQSLPITINQDEALVPLLCSTASQSGSNSPESVPFSALKLALNERGFDIDPHSEEVTRLSSDLEIPTPASELYPELQSAMMRAIESFLGVGGATALREMGAGPEVVTSAARSSPTSPSSPPCKASKVSLRESSPAPIPKPRRKPPGSPVTVRKVAPPRPPSLSSSRSSARHAAREYYFTGFAGLGFCFTLVILRIFCRQHRCWASACQ